MNETQIFDCAIVGGGLAGLAAGIMLARRGKRVVLFEKEHYPYHKVCGEYISNESWPFLNELIPNITSMSLPHINRLKVSAPNGNYFEQHLQQGGIGIARHTLDAMLAQQACADGLMLLEGTRIDDIAFDGNLFTLKASAQTYSAKLVLGAYGKRSALDARLHRGHIHQKQTAKHNYIGVKYHIAIDFPDDLIALHNFKGGYCGISKVDGDRYCLCYLTHAQNLRDNGNQLQQLEQNVLMKNPFLHTIFNQAAFLYQAPLVISQVTFAPRSAVDANVLMLGDAAGTIAPLCGNGMSMALHAAYLAVGLALDFFDGNCSRQQLEQQYQFTWNQHFKNRIDRGAQLQKLFGGVRSTNITIATLKHFPALVNRLIRLTHGVPF